MKKNKKTIAIIAVIASAFLLVTLFLQPAQAYKIRGDESDYQIVLNNKNVPIFLTNTYGDTSAEVRYSTLNYENARKANNAHVELNAGGLIYNPLTSQITSITSITANFTTSGTVTLATSYDGVNYTQTQITSGIRNDTTAKPYYFKLIANENSAVISSVTINYSCVPHEGETIDVTRVVAEESKLEYELGEVYLDTNELVVTAYFSDNTSKVIDYDPDGVNGYNFIFYDPDLNLHYPNNPFYIAGEYLFSVVYRDVESEDSIIITVGKPTPSEATITFKTNSIADSSSVSDSEIMELINITNINVTSVNSTAVYGGSGAARVRITTNSTVGSITFNLSEEVLITGVGLDVSAYNNKTSNIKVTTSTNTTGQTLAVTSGVTKLTYTAFSNDAELSNSLTVSGIAKGQQFYLYGINLTLGTSGPVSVSGVNLSETSLSLAVGKTHTLKAYVQPYNTTNKGVTWTSENNNIATVSSEGLVKGINVGETTITVTTDDGGYSATASITVTELKYDNFYRATTVDRHFNLQDLQKAMDLNAIPVNGPNDPDILVIPIEFSDYEFSSKTLNDIETLFNGSSSDTGYWESVQSFYYKSSFEKLNLTFSVADKYETGLTAAEAAELPTNDGMQYFSTNILRSAISDYVEKNGTNSTQQFDSDNDGFIDAVWMIYSAPNYSNSSEISNISEDYWAYVFWDYTKRANLTNPVQKAYGWASYDFMYEGGGTNKIDAHTYIHETGHLLGLEDYYNYDEESDYEPMGGVDMMDYNVIDHNVWSKMALGWQKPYIVTGDAEITLSPAQENGDAILIADNWNGTSYDEFIMLEFYTPTNLNALDSNEQYRGYYPRGYTVPGIKVMHIDSRLMQYTYTNWQWHYTNYVEPTSAKLKGSNYYYGLAHSNTPSNSFDSEYRLIHLIQASNVNTFKDGVRAANGDLFTAGQTFSMDTYGANFFKNDTRLNNNNALGYTIEIVSVNNESATIRIHKL